MKARSIHLELTHVHASDTRPAVESASRYIRDAGRVGVEASTSVDAALAYLKATGRHKAQASRVAATTFICFGSHDPARVWRQLDDAFRTKAGEYSRRGGNKVRRGDDHRSSGRARLAVFADATLPYDLSEEDKIRAAIWLATAIRDRYGCAIEIAWHLKAGKLDHFHMLISTRTVDKGGVGEIIRAFNGIASKCTSEVLDGRKRLAGFAEFIRHTYAEILTRMTGVTYDARSFKRQGREDTPVPWVSRRRIEEEAAKGSDLWRQERTATIAKRNIQPSSSHLAAPIGAAAEIAVRPSTAVSTSSPPRRFSCPHPQVKAPVAPIKSKRISLPHGSFGSASKTNGLQSNDPADVAERINRQVDRELRAEGDAYLRENAQRRTEVVSPSAGTTTNFFRARANEKLIVNFEREFPVTNVPLLPADEMIVSKEAKALDDATPATPHQHQMFSTDDEKEDRRKRRLKEMTAESDKRENQSEARGSSDLEKDRAGSHPTVRAAGPPEVKQSDCKKEARQLTDVVADRREGEAERTGAIVAPSCTAEELRAAAIALAVHFRLSGPGNKHDAQLATLANLSLKVFGDEVQLELGALSLSRTSRSQVAQKARRLVVATANFQLSKLLPAMPTGTKPPSGSGPQQIASRRNDPLGRKT